jgi:hypothetical protein
VLLLSAPGQGQQAPVPPGQGAQPTAADLVVPSDLRPLLLPKQSEIRLVQVRYTLDRATLAGNYAGGMRSGPGRAGAPPATAGQAQPTPAPVGAPVPAPSDAPAQVPASSQVPGMGPPPPPLSPARLARLKRFDVDWQRALAALDAGRLSPAGMSDLESLKKTIASNLQLLDQDAARLASLSPLLPFAPALVSLIEARIRLEDVDAQRAAGIVTEATRQISQVSRRVEAGLSGSAGQEPSAAPLRVDRDRALRAAATNDALRAALAEWFAFYNGYDPLFTWWMGLPYGHADEALKSYSALLRDKVARAAIDAPNVPDASSRPLEASAPPRYPSVPDLRELIALPQDEMTAIVQRFQRAIGRGGRGGGSPPPSRDAAFYQGWLAALRTLDFGALSRNAQVDYLYIRSTAERQLRRAGVAWPSNPPRKTDSTGIPGAARGRDALASDLQDELIPYTPEEVIAIGERELAWCEAEMKKAARQMGLGDDWKRALEKVKGIHPPPGGQAAVVRGLMFEAVDYLRAKDLLTVPSVAAESLRMIMMTPERQLVNPFFTGGSLISVSYPTNTMEYEARVQSMRGNNTPFSHATAFHEMIPGHNLVFYTTARFAGYRPSLGGNTPFYGEGWPLYWELHLYDLGFEDTPEKRVGALFWRMHRCARIVFSLKFHLGEWSPQECIDYLVDRVGFERDNATAEVRRSFQGGYGPLYQAAYLLGGLQLRALRNELVGPRGLTEKQFHDEVLRQGNMPIALLRLALGRQALSPEMSVEWRFRN